VRCRENRFILIDIELPVNCQQFNDHLGGGSGLLRAGSRFFFYIDIPKRTYNNIMCIIRAL